MKICSKSILMLFLSFFVTKNAFAQETTICDCVSTTLAMLEEAQASDYDVETMNTLEAKYKSAFEDCEKMTEGFSDEEKEQMEITMKACSDYAGMESLMQEMMNVMMRKMNEEMNDEGTDGANTEILICECVDMTVEMMQKALELNFDPTKMKALEEEYKERSEKCQKLSNGKSEEETKAMEVTAKNCPGFEKMEVLMEEMKEAMIKVMKNMPEENGDDEDGE